MPSARFINSYQRLEQEDDIYLEPHYEWQSSDSDSDAEVLAALENTNEQIVTAPAALWFSWRAIPHLIIKALFFALRTLTIVGTLWRLCVGKFIMNNLLLPTRNFNTTEYNQNWFRRVVDTKNNKNFLYTHINTQDGRKIFSATYNPTVRANKTEEIGHIIIVNPNAALMHTKIGEAMDLAEATGVPVTIFDYCDTGCSQSHGWRRKNMPIIDDLTDDALSVAYAILDSNPGITADNLYFNGYSIGGTVATRAATQLKNACKNRTAPQSLQDTGQCAPGQAPYLYASNTFSSFTSIVCHWVPNILWHWRLEAKNKWGRGGNWLGRAFYCIPDLMICLFCLAAHIIFVALSVLPLIILMSLNLESFTGFLYSRYPKEKKGLSVIRSKNEMRKKYPPPCDDFVIPYRASLFNSIWMKLQRAVNWLTMSKKFYQHQIQTCKFAPLHAVINADCPILEDTPFINNAHSSPSALYAHNDQPWFDVQRDFVIANNRRHDEIEELQQWLQDLGKKCLISDAAFQQRLEDLTQKLQCAFSANLIGTAELTTFKEQTERMLDYVFNSNCLLDDKQAAIAQWEGACRNHSQLYFCLKTVIALVIVALVSFVLGGTIATLASSTAGLHACLLAMLAAVKGTMTKIAWDTALGTSVVGASCFIAYQRFKRPLDRIDRKIFKTAKAAKAVARSNDDASLRHNSHPLSCNRLQNRFL